MPQHYLLPRILARTGATRNEFSDRQLRRDCFAISAFHAQACAMMNWLFRLSVVSLLFVIAGGTARAQGVGASGELRGLVTDQNRATIAGAKIVATAAETGLQRSLIVSESGEYRFPNLPPATYDVSAAFQGFETAIKKGVIVTVGETVVLDFQLNVSSVSANLEVPWEP